jgi:hypothetical protein
MVSSKSLFFFFLKKGHPGARVEGFFPGVEASLGRLASRNLTSVVLTSPHTGMCKMESASV